MRTALLAAVSHDLRTPLASAKAAVTSLRSRRRAVERRRTGPSCWPPPTSRWTGSTRLVDNLLDMSRLQAGALSVFPRPVGLDEVVARALRRPGRPGRRESTVDIPDDLPEVLADPGLLERVIANLVAQRAAATPARPAAAADRQRARRPGRAAGGRPRARASRPRTGTRMFAPFQRLGDTDNTTGVGLGLALSRGLTEAMGGTLEPPRTPPAAASP